MLDGSRFVKTGDRIKITVSTPEELAQLPAGCVIGFIRGYAAEAPAALVRLDAPITLGSITGDSLVMELRYEGASWEFEREPGSQTVSLDLYARPPSASMDPEVPHVALKTHAVFEVLSTAI